MPDRPVRNGRPEHPKNCSESPGLPPEIDPHVCAPETAPARPLSLAWITDELLAYTQEFWSGRLGRPVTEDEAIEMLLNVKRLAETLLRAEQEEGDGTDR